jgi:galactokinase
VINIELRNSVIETFKSKFNGDFILVNAPGRINLIGEHTDYNDGFVMPAAVDKQIIFALSPNQNQNFNFYSIDFKASVSFGIYDLVPGNNWHNYLMGVIDGITKRGVSIGGVNCVMQGDIPGGAGMSSSAALCSGFGFGLNEIFQLNHSRFDLAKIGQAAEHNFAGVKCGIMDQFASLFGKEESSILLDCRSLEYEYLPFHFPDIEILLIDTKVKHSLGNSEYNNRREACEEGVEVMKKNNSSIHSLRDASFGDLENAKSYLSEDVFTKCHFVISEIDRTRRAARFLKEGALNDFGKLMYETHWGLSKEYEVSCKESDFLVALASENENILGARQMGGGFGGCVIHLIRRGEVPEYSSKVKEKYIATFKKEPDFYSVNLSDGVKILDK